MDERGGGGRPRPRRLDRLPEQYFAALLGRIAAASADGGAPIVDLGRGNPEVGPPDHVVEALKEAAARPDGHGYAPFRGLPALHEAIAHRYRTEYGAEIDPEREVAVVPGGKQALLELALVLGEQGRTILVPDPYYPDYPSGIALAGAEMGLVPLDPAAGWQPDLDAAPPAAALYLNFPSNPCAVTAHAGLFRSLVDYAQRTGTTVVHDAAYIDLVFDGRPPASFLAVPGAKEAGVELWTMSKTYGMAGWRIAFVIGNEEIVERLNMIGDHSRVGMLAALQHAAIAALEGPQDSVEERRAMYERRRDRLAAALPEPPVCEGSFYVWLRLPAGVTPERLLTEHRVALAPGEGFGPSGAGWARLSLAVADDLFDEGVRRLAPVLEAALA
jgi:L-glutamine---4-(methylsulfanyl)-2-oxobutanoate aminotransferase